MTSKKNVWSVIFWFNDKLYIYIYIYISHLYIVIVCICNCKKRPQINLIYIKLTWRLFLQLSINSHRCLRKKSRYIWTVSYLNYNQSLNRVLGCWCTRGTHQHQTLARAHTHTHTHTHTLSLPLTKTERSGNCSRSDERAPLIEMTTKGSAACVWKSFPFLLAFLLLHLLFSRLWSFPLSISLCPVPLSLAGPRSTLR